MSRLEAQLGSIVDRFVADFRKVVQNEVRRELQQRGRGRDKVGEQVRERVFHTRSESRQEIREGALRLLKQGPASVGEIADRMEVGRRRVVSALYEMCDEGVVQQVGSGRATKYELS